MIVMTTTMNNVYLREIENSCLLKMSVSIPRPYQHLSSPFFQRFCTYVYRYYTWTLGYTILKDLLYKNSSTRPLSYISPFIENIYLKYSTEVESSIVIYQYIFKGMS